MFYLLQANDNPFLYVPQLDEEFYVDFGKNLLAEGPQNTNLGFFMDPLYGYFLGGLFYIFGDNLIIPRLIQIVSDSAAALLLCLIGRRLWSPATGLLAGLIYALYPVSWFYSLTLLKTTFTTNYVILFTLILLVFVERQTLRNWFLLGLITGIGVYLRGNLILLIPFTMLLPLVIRQHSWRQSIQLSLTYLLGAVILLGGVGLLNKATFGQFAVLPTTGGITLYGANNPQNPTGENTNPDFISKSHPAELFVQYKNEAEKRNGKTLNNSEVSTYWRGQAIKYWFSSFTVLPSLWSHKISHLISHEEIANNQSVDIAARFSPILLPQIPFFALVLGFGLPGIFLALRKDPRVYALLPVVGVVIVTSIVYFSSSRFRLPLVPILILGAAYFFNYATCRTWEIRKNIPMLVAASIFTVSMLINGPRANVSQQEINLALAHAEIGQTNEAILLLQQLENDLNDHNYYQKIRGYVSLLAKDYKSAYFYSKMALEEDPGDYGTMSVAGIAALELNDMEEALELFSIAYQISNDNEFHYWIGKSQATLGNTEIAIKHLEYASRLLPQSSPIGIKAKSLLEEITRKQN